MGERRWFHRGWQAGGFGNAFKGPIREAFLVTTRRLQIYDHRGHRPGVENFRPYKDTIRDGCWRMRTA